ncbi:F-box/LRR-repeat protein 2-like isoform X1 [Macrosteles quadrilineatus]|uniref:F-box/LRR-repeat protein 2-like isoform X1 n=1 Tax=Macrosteles quadrilineatus TaxID=74068 RepID=UPI0023E2C7A1|nr:F-box/LRR-repeat protein 2-like isoform X1 [Macrosteles quadrilineatus]XP_054270785.1 F-box/LRR-repeat protein 2-like isoform X1 [Macrosteles quadrilineatus]XP_054270786.1 F-box/LRR-repeat protein 2-like isoform X1 [Macrosteles quadrilineatus]
MASVNSLPNEILLEVFSYLDVYDISISVMYVCKRWNIVARDSMLWNNLVFKVDGTMSPSKFKGIVHHLKFLKHVTLRSRKDTNDIICALVQFCPCIVGIKLKFCSDMGADTTRKLSDSYTDLKILSFDYSSNIPSQCFDDIVFLPNLTELNLSYTLLTSDQFRSISEACTKIVSLNINYVKGIQEEDMVVFLSPRCNCLESLSVLGELFTDKIFQYLEKCCKLKLLRISSCTNISDTCLISVEKMKSLKSLTLVETTKLSAIALRNFYYHSHTVRNVSHFMIRAKRKVNNSDMSVWYNNCSNIKQIHVEKYCDCVLERDGFKVYMMGESFYF